MLNIIKEYYKCNIARFAEYRADFFIGITAITLSNVAAMVLFWVIFQAIPNINGWNFWEVVFMLGIMDLSIGIWHVFLSGVTPWKLERLFQNGELDRIILYPINPLLHLFIKNLDDDGIGDFLSGILILAVSSMNINVVWSISKISILLIMVLSGAAIFTSIALIMTAIGFWTIRTQWMSDLLWAMTDIVQFPLNIYNPAIRFVFTFMIPFGFLSFYPAQMFIGSGEYLTYSYMTPIVAIMLMLISYRFWKFGLKNYTSVGH